MNLGERKFSSMHTPSFVDRPGTAPTVVLVHGAGFHARCWDALGDFIPQRRLAVNLRGHGGVPAPDTALRWFDFASDVASACDEAGVDDAIGVGHSLGGYAVVVAAALRPELFRGLLLIDPVIFPESTYGREVPTPPARRRSSYASVEDLRARLAVRPPFSRWNSRVLDDYCRFALDIDGAFLCTPEFEALIYATASAADANPYELFNHVRVPVLVLCSGRVDEDNPFSRSPTVSELARCFAHGRDAFDVRYSHFLPMEAPQVVAEWIHSLV